MEIAGFWRIKKFIKQSQRISTWKALILTYHRVADLTPDPFSLCVSVENFKKQMEVLKNRYRIVKLRDLLKESQNDFSFGKVVCLTFDDGYRDNFQCVRPMLERLKIPATFFIPAEPLESLREFYWDWLAKIFLQPGTLPDKLNLKIFQSSILL